MKATILEEKDDGLHRLILVEITVEDRALIARLENGYAVIDGRGDDTVVLCMSDDA